MTSPLERAATALGEALKAGCHVGKPGKDGLSIIDGEVDLRDVVRAVLEAIREPSEGMGDAYWAAIEAHPNYAGESEQYPLARDAWQAMIDAALSEGG